MMRQKYRMDRIGVHNEHTVKDTTGNMKRVHESVIKPIKELYNRKNKREHGEAIMRRLKDMNGLRFALLTLVLLSTLSPLSLISNSTGSNVDTPSRGVTQSGASAVDWWPTYHHDSGHTSYSTSSAPDSNATCWISSIGENVQSSPAIVDGILYVSTPFHDGYGSSTNVYALNAYTKDQIWMKNVAGEISLSDKGSPAVAGGLVYVTAQNWLHALNATTGDEVWSFLMPSAYSTNPTLSTASDIVYVCADNVLYARNASTGDHLWNYTTCGAYICGAPAVKRLYTDDVVFVVSSYQSQLSVIYRLNGKTGYVYCNVSIPTRVFCAPTVGGGMVFIPGDGSIWALYDYSLQQAWWVSTGYGAENTLSIGYGMVYACSSEGWAPCGGYVSAYNISTGLEVWNYRTGGEHPYIDGSAAVADGKVFVGAEDDHKIYAFDAITGSVLWTYVTGGSIWSSPSIAHCRLYVGSSDGKLYAFGPVGLPTHDIAVTSIIKDPLNKAVVCQGYTMHFNITLENQGDYDEWVNLTLYWNTTLRSSTFVFVEAWSATTRWRVFDTTGLARYKTYCISAYAEPVQDETHTSDNRLDDGSIAVSFPGDVNADRKVDLKDVFAVNKAFGSRPGSANWNPNCDITDDKFVDLRDKSIVASNYGYVEPP